MKASLKYGIAGGIISGIIFYAEYFTGVSEKSSGMYSLGATAIILIVAVFLYLRKISSPQLNGFYTFGYGFKNGMAVVSACAATIAVFTFIFFKFINPEYIESFVLSGMEQMRNNGIGETEIQKAAENFRSIHSPFIETIKAMLRTILMGGVFSLVISLVVKRTE